MRGLWDAITLWVAIIVVALFVWDISDGCFLC